MDRVSRSTGKLESGGLRMGRLRLLGPLPVGLSTYLASSYMINRLAPCPVNRDDS